MIKAETCCILDLEHCPNTVLMGYCHLFICGRPSVVCHELSILHRVKSILCLRDFTSRMMSVGSNQVALL